MDDADDQTKCKGQESVLVAARNEESEDQRHHHAHQRNEREILIPTPISSEMEGPKERADKDEKVGHPFRRKTANCELHML